MNNKRGITLVALVITVVILLILAAISIIGLTKTGVLKNAELAKEEYQKSVKKEENDLNKINEYITIFYPNYKEELRSEYRLYILSGALYNVGKTWINKGLKEDSATISKIFVDKLYPKEKNLQ